MTGPSRAEDTVAVQVRESPRDKSLYGNRKGPPAKRPFQFEVLPGTNAVTKQ